MTRLILIRHPQTDWNAEGRYQGQTDVPLNEVGRAQSREVAAALATTAITAVYASDLRRARELAEAIASAAGVPLHLDPRLREIDQGEWEGLLGKEVRDRWPDLLERRSVDPGGFAPPGGERFTDVRSRVLACVAGGLGAHEGEPVAIASHGLALAIVRAQYERLPWVTVWDLILPNATPYAIEVEDRPNGPNERVVEDHPIAR